MRIVTAILTAGLLLLLAGPSPVLASGDELLSKVPQSATAIMVIDVDAVLSSPLAVRENWKQTQAEAYSQRPIILPPEASRIVLAAQFDAANHFERGYEVAVMSLREPMGMSSIARAEGGYVDTINGLEAAWTPSDAYFVALEERTLGVMYPANRQLVSRWADFARRNSIPVVSHYLRRAAESVSPQSQIVLAIDLKDVVLPHKTSEAIQNAQSLKGNQRKIDQLSQLVPTIQGVTLQVQLTETARGRMSIDFASSSAPFANFAQPFVLEAFDRLDLHLAELSEWRVSLSGNSIVLEGPFTDSGLRRIFSLLEIPTTKFTTVSEESLSSASGDPTAKASQAYFNSVTTLIEDMRKTLDQSRDNHAVWFERYARKIDALPILNVDEELLAWGAGVGEAFRSIALYERSGNLKAGVRKSSAYGSYAYSYGGFGYYGRAYTTETQSNERSRITREEGAKVRQMRFSSWNDIENQTAAIRQEMTKKYQVEF